MKVWMSNPNRRKFLKTSGTMVGLSSLSGLAAGQASSKPTAGIQNSIEPAPIEVVEREIVKIAGEVRYCFIKVANTETGETREAAAKFENGEVATTEAVSGTVASASAANTGTIVTTQGWDDLYDEIKAGFADAIQRADWYQTTVDDCNVYSGYTHQLYGASVEYHKAINDLNSTLLGAVIGAAAGLIAGYVGSPVLSAILGVGGAAVGALAGFAFKHLKDSNILSFAAIDWAVCAAGSCIPGVMVSGSGKWKDTNKDDMYHVYLEENAHLQR